MKNDSMNAFRRSGTMLAALFALWTVACFVFFNWFYAYHFCYKEQNQLFLWLPSAWAEYLGRTHWLAQWTGEMLTQFYYYDYAGAALLTVVLLVLGITVYGVMRRLSVGQIVSGLVALLVMTLEAVMHFSLQYTLSGTMVKLLFAAMLLAALCLYRIRRPAALLAVAVWLFFTVPWRPVYPHRLSEYLTSPTLWKPSAPDFEAERLLAVSTQYERRNYHRVVKLVEDCPRERLGVLSLYYYYLAQARLGRLPETLLRYGEVNELGTFWTIGPKAPLAITRRIHELYWLLGDMTYAERAAMMSCVFAPDNKNVRMLLRLAEVNIVKQDTAAAEKYLALLRHTQAYKRRACDAWNNRELQAKRPFINQMDSMQTGDNTYRIMTQLLESNPKNVVARDYLLCSDLLLKDMEDFKRDYDRYCVATGLVPQHRLYQEALCIYLAGSGAGEEDWRRYVTDTDVMARFANYNRNRGSRQFADTYWYYFDTKKVKGRP